MSFNLTDELACVRYCAERCPRCRYVSISERAHDCSWYNQCNLDELDTEPRWLRHKTYDVSKLMSDERAAKSLVAKAVEMRSPAREEYEPLLVSLDLEIPFIPKRIRIRVVDPNGIAKPLLLAVALLAVGAVAVNHRSARTRSAS